MREPDGSMNERNVLEEEIVEHRWQEAGRRNKGGWGLTVEGISGISGTEERDEDGITNTKDVFETYTKTCFICILKLNF